MSRFSILNWLLVLGVVLLAAVPLLVTGSETEFAGADGAAVERIDESGYQPWLAPLFEPWPEVASGLFALQAAIGGAVLGYVFGVARTRRRTPPPVDPPA
jgi:cobalt/nickel transport protein